MNRLLIVYGIPHEALHALALRLIGRQAVYVGRTHVVIPKDLTTRQYVFVAGLPAAVFIVITAAGFVGMLNAPTLASLFVWLVVAAAGGIGVIGTMGDMQLIWMRLQREDGRS